MKLYKYLRYKSYSFSFSSIKPEENTYHVDSFNELDPKDIPLSILLKESAKCTNEVDLIENLFTYKDQKNSEKAYDEFIDKLLQTE